MKEIMPQEIEVWYLLPALRREITKILISEHKLNQKEIAKLLNVSEPAISQYLKSKRAGEVSFSKKDGELIKETAKKIIENPDSMMKELYQLSVAFRGNKVICDIHRSKDKNVPKKCDICFR